MIDRRNGFHDPDDLDVDAGDDPDDDPDDDTDDVADTGADLPEGEETVRDAIDRVVRELPGIERRPGDDGDELAATDRVFAVVAPGRLEVLLDSAVAAAALRTPDVQASARGRGWVTFRPSPDSRSRLDLDRAEAWLRLAHRAASGADVARTRHDPGSLPGS